MLFTTGIIWKYPEVYEDEIQEWLEYATGKRIMIGVRSTDNFREENGFDKKKGTYDLLHFFGRNTANSNDLSPPE